LLIGERACDTRDLFATTQTQRLTLNANTSGTLKLSMLVTWLPLENCEEAFIYYNPTQCLTMGGKEKRLSSYTMSRLANSNTLGSNNASTLPGQDFSALQYRSTTLMVDTTSSTATTKDG
jgi:hypothetical protein